MAHLDKTTNDLVPAKDEEVVYASEVQAGDRIQTKEGFFTVADMQPHRGVGFHGIRFRLLNKDTGDSLLYTVQSPTDQVVRKKANSFRGERPPMTKFDVLPPGTLPLREDYKRIMNLLATAERARGKVRTAAQQLFKEEAAKFIRTHRMDLTNLMDKE